MQFIIAQIMGIFFTVATMSVQAWRAAFVLLGQFPANAFFGLSYGLLVSMTLWVIFDIAVGAYTNIILHASTIASIQTVKIRLNRKRKGEPV